MDKVISRGYVKWTDKDGTFHKEPLVDHPEMLAKATADQKLDAEAVAVSMKEAEEFYKARDAEPVIEEAPKSGAEETKVVETPTELPKKAK